MALLVAVEEGSQRVLQFSVIKPNYEWEVDDDGCLLGGVDDSGWVVALPVVEAGQPGGRVELPFGKELEETVIHPYLAELGLFLLEIGQDHCGYFIEIGLGVCFPEEVVDVAEEIQLVSGVLVL
jgi:hypothetical protein